MRFSELKNLLNACYNGKRLHRDDHIESISVSLVNDEEVVSILGKSHKDPEKKVYLCEKLTNIIDVAAIGDKVRGKEGGEYETTVFK